MKVVVAMNAFKGSMSASNASRLVAEGFSEGYREADVTLAPMADGGDGTLMVLVNALSGRTESHTVTGPYGQPVLAPLGFVDDGGTAIIESASCSGLALPFSGERDVRVAQSRGVGELMAIAARRGARRIVVGIGGTAMNDGGIGAVQSAGGVVVDSSGRSVPAGTIGLARVSSVGYGDIPRLFEGVEVTGISDVKSVLVGPGGATRVFGPQKGLGPDEVVAVDTAMSNYARILGRDLGDAGRKDPSDVPMAGAGGGLGAALWAFFGARLQDGAGFAMDAIGLRALMKDASLVITGEGNVDSQTATGKVPFAVATLAYECGVPAIVIGGGLSEDIIADHPPQYGALFDTTVRPMSVDAAISAGPKTLRFISRQLGSFARAVTLSGPARSDTSAGGIVVRTNPTTKKREVLLIADRYGMIAPPKGHIEPGETYEEAAIREVREETGLDVVSRASLGAVRYRFPWDSGVTEKTVHYFLMEAVGGHLAAQPGETLDVMWVAEDALGSFNTYKDTYVAVGRAFSAYEPSSGNSSAKS